MNGKKSQQGTNYYFDSETEKFRYNPYRKHNREIAEKAYKNHENLPFPLHVIIETSGICDLKCPFCCRNVMTRPQKLMDLPTFQKIVDECAENRVYSLSLYALGEPLINPSLPEMIRYAKRMGIPYVDVSTNGTYDMRGLLGTGLNEIIVSIDGNEKTHEALRVGSNYNVVYLNTVALMHERRAMGYSHPFVRAQMIDIPETHDQIDEYIEFWKTKVDVVYIKNLEVMAQALGDKNLCKKSIDKRLKDRVPCKQLYFGITINANGNIAYCCHDPKGESILGHIESMTLAEAWTRMKSIRVDQNAGIYMDFCKKCVDWRW